MTITCLYKFVCWVISYNVKTSFNFKEKKLKFNLFLQDSGYKMGFGFL